jgi:hypothetical protein
MGAVLPSRDAATWLGRRDRVLLLTMHNSGARTSEIINLRCPWRTDSMIPSVSRRTCRYPLSEPPYKAAHSACHSAGNGHAPSPIGSRYRDHHPVAWTREHRATH